MTFAPERRRTLYGQAIGIIMLDTAFPRIPGDVGNATTFPFPVRYKIVPGASPQRVVMEADPALLEPFVRAAEELEGEGVRAIATSCGFLAMFHQELIEAVNIPVFTSSLLQVHLAHRIINKTQKVGIITARAQSLTEKHFRGVGLQNIPLVVIGMDESHEFTAVFLEGKATMDVDQCGKEIVEVSKELVRDNPEVGAIVLECTNMPPFSRAVQQAVNLPVFDVVTLIKYAYSAVVQEEFKGYM
ncbi:MAG: aspartate/glutamate racemase family protein [Thermodesulfobacteriota bacterium]